MNTYTVGQIKAYLNGLSDDQPVLLIDDDGCAVEIENIDPLTVTNEDGTQILTLEFTTGEQIYGFNEDGTKIFTNEE